MVWEFRSLARMIHFEKPKDDDGKPLTTDEGD
jgi:hypothetical protein